MNGFNKTVMNRKRENSPLVCHIIDEEFNEFCNDSKYNHHETFFKEINKVKNNPGHNFLDLYNV